MQTQTPQTEITTLNVSGYPNGIYVVAVQSGEQTVTKKTLIN